MLIDGIGADVVFNGDVIRESRKYASLGMLSQEQFLTMQ